MSLDRVQKRDVLKGLLLAAAGAPLCAQDRRLFGVTLPKELTNLIPARPLNILMTADAIIRLERDADRKGLPASPLERNKGKRISAADGLIYQPVLQRLVALIDRSEALDLGIADEAGGLLAELHASQHELPQALLSLPEGIMLPGVKLRYAEPSPTSAAPLSKAKDFASLKGEYARLFQTATIRPEHAESTDWHLTMMTRSKPRYQPVADDTGVPWYFIAVCHALESSFNFRAHLHNGDFPLSARTRQVPAGRPLKWLPPSDWESSARDAIRLLGFAGQADWSLERTLHRLEAYNGFGYRPYGVASPYLWSFSSHYTRGKYVADGRWSPTARSQQCGAAVMLKLLTDAGEIVWPTA